MNPTISVILGALTTGAAIGGAGTINRTIARGAAYVTGATPGGLAEQAVEFVVPAAAVAVSFAANPTSRVGSTLASAAGTVGTMALVESTAKAVRSLVGPSQD